MLHAAPSLKSLTASPVADPEVGDEPRLLHEFYTQAAVRWPDQVAIETPPSSSQPIRRAITYAELDRQSDALAGYLREFVAGECFVAILLPRNSDHIYRAQLAVLKSGAAYICIDPTFPDAQVEYILGDARPVAVLTDAQGVGRVRHIKADLGCVLDAVAWVEQFEGRVKPPSPARWLSPKSLAYAIYTSGTTGKPKGVMIEHGGIANLVAGDLATLGIEPEDRVGQNSSCAYDSSVEEIWMALAAGATLVVMDDETTRLGPDLAPWLRRERITLFSPPPTLLRTMGCVNPEKELPLLRRLHVGGESLPADVAERWSRGRILSNDYGPTECSVTATRTVIRPGDPISIGRPLPGLKAWVLNDRLEEVADGDTGELCLGGAGLARGYLNDSGLTARKFPVHARFGRIYRTGDLVHRDAGGNIFCHGRIDSQVKIRGYRIELEAIESRLAGCSGVREAACRLQGEGPTQQVVAFIVPADRLKLPHFDQLKEAIRRQLPEYMVPSHFGILDRLPRQVSGKVDRRALPLLEVHAELSGPVVSPRNPIEGKVAAVFRQVLGITEAIGVDRDFFHDLGGDSLRAAMAISLLRNDPATASLAVRDLYESRTVENLARRVRPATNVAEPKPSPRPLGRPILATFVQSLWLMLGLVIAGPIAYYLAYHGIPELTADLGLASFVLAAPIILYAGIGLYAAFMVAFAVALKKLLIGKYRPRREPVWGSFYVRNWMVTQAVRLIPWRVLEGTIFQHAVLRMLGARIGKRVHIHRGVNLLHGGWDLLDIGDDVAIHRDVALRLVDLHEGQIVVGSVIIGRGSTLEVRTGMGGNSRMDADSYLSAHSFLTGGHTLTSGELWSGVPAAPAGTAPAPPELPDGSRVLSPWKHGLLMISARMLLAATAVIPLALAALAFTLIQGISASAAAEWILHPALEADELFLGIALIVCSVPLMLIGQCLSMRSLGRIPEGVISRWSPTYIRVWLKMEILDAANEWLSGTLLWRVWLRGAGMRIGKNSELSTIFDTVPELTDVGTDTFLADGIFLGGPCIHRGRVTLARTHLGDNVFLGNYAVIAAGDTIPDGVLLGVCTVADPKLIRPGSSWFGHPPFELPKREILQEDISLTYRPSRLRFAHRLFWELLRFTMPLPAALLVLAWFTLVGQAEETFPLPVLIFGVVPLLDLGFLAALCLFGLALKWLLLGRVRPGTHAFWSFWCFRWDFHYTIWHYCCHGPLSALEGTLLINWYLRAMGVKIGKNVIIGDVFATVVDPDMIELADGATVNALFQAHTFEDRVLKIDKVRIGAAATVGNAATLLYGAVIGETAEVTPNSVVMKHEHLQPEHVYAGCPTRLVG
jgi:non-ribosomal peptide synthetase-like protein